MRKFFSDKNGKLAIAQMPNAPLLAWLFFAILSHFLHEGGWQTFAQLAGKAALILWAGLEIYSGASPFRRVLGVIVLIFSVISLISLSK